MFKIQGSDRQALNPEGPSKILECTSLNRLKPSTVPSLQLCRQISMNSKSPASAAHAAERQGSVQRPTSDQVISERIGLRHRSISGPEPTASDSCCHTKPLPGLWTLPQHPLQVPIGSMRGPSALWWTPVSNESKGGPPLRLRLLGLHGRLPGCASLSRGRLSLPTRRWTLRQWV